MKVQAYITFAGRCEEALAFYTKSIGAEVSGLMRWKESPEADMKGPPGWEDKVMNAAFRIGETQLMADDGMGDKTAEFKGMTLAIEVADDAEAKRVFTALVSIDIGASSHARLRSRRHATIRPPSPSCK